MDELPHSKFSLPDRTYQAIVRAELKKMAELAGFHGHRLGEMEIIIAEITSNLVKHATKGGEIYARPVKFPAPGMEMIVIDHGPGMNKPLKMMEDGISSSKTLGQGLGAIRRLSDKFDLYSLLNWGTILYSLSFLNRKSQIAKNAINISALNVCKKGEVVCGDAYSLIDTGKRIRIALLDGLGHGLQANIAAKEGARSFSLLAGIRPSEQLRIMHNDLKKTRGAVVTLVQIDEVNKQILYCGVGNISMKIVGPAKSRSCLAYNGIVGHIMPSTIGDHHLPWENASDTLVMHSDGLSARWDLQKYPGILLHHGMILCAALFKDFNRDNDDSTVIVAKYVK